MPDQKCFAVAGWKNSGKTGLVTGLIGELTKRGYTISTVKHAHHAFDIDTPGTDSYRHREAGAREVALVSSNRWAIQHELNGTPEPAFKEVISKLDPCDLVIVEGYKKEDIPKVEVIGPECAGPELWRDDANVVAVAIDSPIAGCSLPTFSRNQYCELSDFIVSYVGLNT